MKQSRNIATMTIVAIAVAIMLILAFQNKQAVEPVLGEGHLWQGLDREQITFNDAKQWKQPDISWEPYRVSEVVKGIFMTGHSMGLTSRFEHTVEMTNQAVVNAWVIDVKDDFGTLTYPSKVELVHELGADRMIKVRDFHSKMEVLRENNIYPIARIVTFKDRQAATTRPDWAIKTNTGQVWRDRRGDAWLNPYNSETWDYVIDIAREAAEKGFKEIQFDYVRFPTDGNRSIIDYGTAGQEATMAETIAAFLAYAREELRDYGVIISADIFGLVTTVQDDMGLGQHLETLTTVTDVLSPMVYPSHYALGTYGVAKPDLDPYPIVYTGMKVGRERIEALETDKKKAILRPWLQDFTASYLGQGYYQRYGTDEVRAQIEANKDAGIEEWILWNAGNRYTWDALMEN